MGSLPLGMEPFMWTCPLPFGSEPFPFRKAKPLVFGSEVVSVGSKTGKKTIPISHICQVVSIAE